jgi:hypothetical protein
MSTLTGLPDLDQTIDDLDTLEKQVDKGQRIEQTRRALAANQRTAADKALIGRYYRELAERGLFFTIYGAGKFPWALPVHMPPYLINLCEATARVLLALVRKKLAAVGPDYLLRRVPAGWLSDEMADRLWRYYLTWEPDLALDVLVYGVNTPRGTPFDVLKRSGDYLHAKILEAQSVDTYYGWLRECIQSARRTGVFKDAVFTMQSTGNRPLTDAELDAQVRATYLDGIETAGDGLVFLEIDPENQPSSHNLLLLCRFLSEGHSARQARVRDPRDLFFEKDRLYYRDGNNIGTIGKLISRIVDSDLKAFIRAMEAENETGVIERLRKIFSVPSLWPDLSKHLTGYYLIDKSSITELFRETLVSMAPKTWIISADDLESYRKDPGMLRQLAVKPLHGMSSKGVVVAPDLATVERLCSQETGLAQELLRASPIMPNINPELSDPDAAAGICCEIRLLLHAGSRAVPQSQQRARCILALSRCHYSSRDPGRKIKNDAAGRGWFSNMGTILAVKGELGILNKHAAGLGMGPVCWLK